MSRWEGTVLACLENQHQSKDLFINLFCVALTVIAYGLYKWPQLILISPGQCLIAIFIVILLSSCLAVACVNDT